MCWAWGCVEVPRVGGVCRTSASEGWGSGPPHTHPTGSQKLECSTWPPTLGGAAQGLKRPFWGSPRSPAERCRSHTRPSLRGTDVLNELWCFQLEKVFRYVVHSLFVF